MPPRSYTSLPKRTTLTYKQRAEICEHAAANPTLKPSALADWATRQFRLPKPPSDVSVRNICARADEWTAALAEAGDNAGGKRKKGTVRAPEVEAALLEWLTTQRDQGFTVKGREIQLQAEMYAVDLGLPADTRPKFSNGWLCSFLERHQMGDGSKGKAKSKQKSASNARPSLSDPIPSRIVLTYKQRNDLCEHKLANPTLNYTQLAEWATLKFHLRKYISGPAVSSILKRADEWKRASAEDAKTRKHWRKANVTELDMAITAWITTQHERGRPPSGSEIVAHAKMIANECGIPEADQPQFSKGWLHAFMQRNKLLSSAQSRPSKRRRADSEDEDDATASSPEPCVESTKRSRVEHLLN